MKKFLLIMVLVLGLVGAGAGYYLFVMEPQKALKATPMTDDDATHPAESPASSAHAVKKIEIRDYFVKERKLAVLNGPGEKFFPQRYLYIGAPVTVLEHQDGWGRISPYFVYQQGGPEVAEWVKIDGLTTKMPQLSKQDKEEIVTSYIGHSDDFKTYRNAFVRVTEKLLDEKMCTPEDFEELNGWMKSINYGDRHVYFIYCGGLKVSDKIYFDVDTGEVFYQ